MAALDDFAKQLAGLKTSYASASAGTAQDDIRKQGLQIRSQANGQGIDLNALENAANSLAGVKTDPNSADEQSFRNTVFSSVKAAPVYKNPVQPTTSIGNGQPGTQFANADISDAHKMYTQLQQMIATPFVYNPDSDPLVANARANQAKRSALSSKDMQEDMNARGILDSTVTSDRAAQIYKDGDDAVSAMLPQFAGMAYGQHQQEIQNTASMAASLLGMGQDERNFESDSAFKKGTLTGNYMDPAAQAVIDHLLSLKQTAENPWTTSTQLQGLHSQADEDRAKLHGMGIDDSLFGADQGYEQALGNVGKAGTMTLAAKDNLIKTILGIGDNYSAIPAGTADQLRKMPGFESVADYVSALEGKQTLKGAEASSLNASRSASAANASGNLALSQDKYKHDLKGEQATAAWSMDVLNADSREEALQYLYDNTDEITSSGADPKAILAALNAKFPGTGTEKNGSTLSADSDKPPTTWQIYQEAQKQAESLRNWPKMTPEQQNAAVEGIVANLKQKYQPKQ